MFKYIYRNKLYKMINELTLDDFLFDVGTTTGLINPEKVRLVSRVKKISGDVVYKVKMPYIDSCFSNNQGVLREPVFNEIITTDIDTYKKYKEENKDYDNVEIEMFYINAFFYGDKSNRLKKMFDKYYNIYYFNRMDYPIPVIFSYYNRNIPPFITSNISFSDKDKQQLIEDIKQYLVEKL